ncbi:MAG: RNA polymerase sigma factor [Steroidobacteraceae bacterium]
MTELAGDAMGDETERVACARNGDVAAFEALYRDHVGRVYGLCLRMTGHPSTAEDLTQDTFVNAWRSLPGYEGRSRFSTWLHRIAVNAVLAQRRAPLGRNEISMTDAEGETMEFAAEQEMDEATPIDLERAIAALPAGARDIVVLHGIYGYSHEEAASMLDLAVGTCKAQLHRARRLMRARMCAEQPT